MEPVKFDLGDTVIYMDYITSQWYARTAESINQRILNIMMDEKILLAQVRDKYELLVYPNGDMKVVPKEAPDFLGYRNQYVFNSPQSVNDIEEADCPSLFICKPKEGDTLPFTVCENNGVFLSYNVYGRLIITGEGFLEAVSLPSVCKLLGLRSWIPIVQTPPVVGVLE